MKVTKLNKEADTKVLNYRVWASDGKIKYWLLNKTECISITDAAMKLFDKLTSINKSRYTNIIANISTYINDDSPEIITLGQAEFNLVNNKVNITGSSNEAIDALENMADNLKTYSIIINKPNTRAKFDITKFKKK